MVTPTNANFVSYETLYDVTVTGGLAANIRTKIGEDTTRKILSQQAVEICEVEIVPPTVGGTGAGEALEQIKLIIDGEQYLGGDHLIIRADLDSLFAPPKPSNLGEIQTGVNQGKRNVFKLGLGLPDLAGIIQAMPGKILENTTAKTRLEGNIDVEVLVGNTAILADFRIILKGWRYRTQETINKFLRAVYGQAKRIPMMDPVSGRDFSFTYPAIATSTENFTKTIGGDDQDPNKVLVRRLLRWARNSKATTPNTDYSLSFDDDNVDTRDEDMEFDVPRNRLLIVNKLGVRPGTNHLFTKVEINNEVMTREETVPAAKNDLIFGRKTAIGAGIQAFAHDFRQLPALQPLFISNETGEIIIRDDGTAIPDGTNFGSGSLVVLDALEILDPNFDRQSEVIRQAPQGTRI